MQRDLPEKQPETRRSDQDLTVADLSANVITVPMHFEYPISPTGDEAEGWLLLPNRELNEIWREYEETGRERRQPERERRAA